MECGTVSLRMSMAKVRMALCDIIVIQSFSFLKLLLFIWEQSINITSSLRLNSEDMDEMPQIRTCTVC